MTKRAPSIIFLFAVALARWLILNPCGCLSPTDCSRYRCGHRAHGTRLKWNVIRRARPACRHRSRTGCGHRVQYSDGVPEASESYPPNSRPRIFEERADGVSSCDMVIKLFVAHHQKTARERSGNPCELFSPVQCVGVVELRLACWRHSSSHFCQAGHGAGSSGAWEDRWLVEHGIRLRRLRSASLQGRRLARFEAGLFASVSKGVQACCVKNRISECSHAPCRRLAKGMNNSIQQTSAHIGTFTLTPGTGRQAGRPA